MSLAIGARGEANERQDKQKTEKKVLWQERKKEMKEEEEKREEKGEDPLEVKWPSALVPSALPTQSL